MASSGMNNRNICGFYYYTAFHNRSPTYIPQLKVDAHTSIITSIARTTLLQTFVNPVNHTIEKLYYTFPLFDGVSIVDFTCTIGQRVIKGIVKERNQARATFDHAVAKGETAGLLEQAVDTMGDVFKTSVGNIPAGAEIKVQITYLGELKHDAEINGLRLTIPTCIAPRYGSYLDSGINTSHNAMGATPDGGIKITVDAQVSSGSRITSIQSPSHQIAVTIGKTSNGPEQELSFEKASATLSLGTAELEKDFILQLTATDMGNPLAILEEHPSIPGQRAIMATLVPKFALSPEKPEVVFVCDRSGSMSDKIPDLINALQLFVKSLTVGIKFNICSFGSAYSFLWERSRAYDSASMSEAMHHIQSFAANYGGTRMYLPIEHAIKQRYQDMNLEIFLLTDGQISHQDQLVRMINHNVATANGAIRLFTLGIGDSVSHSLIESVARAGNGFSQAISRSEEMGGKVVRMLKGALFPHVNDYTLEVKYEADEDDYELIDTVEESLVIHIPEPKAASDFAETAAKKPISLFDTSLDEEDGDTKKATQSDQDKFAGLPPINVPKLLQAPHPMPSLFPFIRSTVYLLMSADHDARKPKSVILRGTSQQGPLELEIPITQLGEKGLSIHQLAAKKAVGELEEGRGWIFHAKDAEGVLLKQKYDGKFQDMVEREAVRLGVDYQVGGKWCSFVAVAPEGEVETRWDLAPAAPPSRGGNGIGGLFGVRKNAPSSYGGSGGLFGNAPSSSGGSSGLFGNALSSSGGSSGLFGNTPSSLGGSGGNGGLFGARAMPASSAQSSTFTNVGFGNHSQLDSEGSFSFYSGNAVQCAESAPAPPSRFGSSNDSVFAGCARPFAPASSSGGSLFGSTAQSSSNTAFRTSHANFGSILQPSSNNHFGSSAQNSAPAPPTRFGSSNDSGFGGSAQPFAPAPSFSGSLFGNPTPSFAPTSSSGGLFGSPAPSFAPTSSSGSLFGGNTMTASGNESIHSTPTLPRLVLMQGFEGLWPWSDELLSVMQWNEASLISAWGSAFSAKYGDKNVSQSHDVIATTCIVAWLEKEKAGEKDSWELLVDKARAWLETQLPGQDINGLVEMAKDLI